MRPLPCRSPALNLAGARSFHAFALYWVGRRFERFILSSISRQPVSGPGGRGPVVDLQYGGFAIQLWPACARVPVHVSGGPEGESASAASTASSSRAATASKW
jgi:hypothetical protein